MRSMHTGGSSFMMPPSCPARGASWAPRPTPHESTSAMAGLVNCNALNSRLILVVAIVDVPLVVSFSLLFVPPLLLEKLLGGAAWSIGAQSHELLGVGVRNLFGLDSLCTALSKSP